MTHHLHQTVVNHNGIRIRVVVLQQVAHLDMSSKASHLIADGVFETQYDAHRDNHHSQSNGNTGNGNTDDRATDFPFVTLITIDSLSYE